MTQNQDRCDLIQKALGPIMNNITQKQLKIIFLMTKF